MHQDIDDQSDSGECGAPIWLTHLFCALFPVALIPPPFPSPIFLVPPFRSFAPDNLMLHTTAAYHE